MDNFENVGFVTVNLDSENGENGTFWKRSRDNSILVLSLPQSLFSSVSLWTGKQLENDNVDGEHIIRFLDKNAVFKFIRLSVDVAWAHFTWS